MKVDKKLLYVSIFSISWALNILVNKHGLNLGTKPFPYTVQTNLVSALILTLVILLTKKQDFKQINLRLAKGMIGIGFFVGIAYIAGIYGLKLTSSINYGFIIIFSLIKFFLKLKIIVKN